MHQQSGWTVTPSRLIGAPTSTIPTIFMPDALPDITLIIYSGLGQPPNMLACIPGVTICTDTCPGMLFTFQQNSASAHYARETIGLLQPNETPDFIPPTPILWPPNSPVLNTYFTFSYNFSHTESAHNIADINEMSMQ